VLQPHPNSVTDSGDSCDVVVLIGDLDVSRRTCVRLSACGYDVIHLIAPSDEDLNHALRAPAAAVAVLVRGDVVALRYALLVEHLQPQIPLVITVFDRSVAGQLRAAIPNCTVTSPAEVAVPEIVDACLTGNHNPTRTARNTGARALRRAFSKLRTHDISSRLLLTGLAGLAFVFLVEWVIRVAVLGTGVTRGFLAAAETIATVGGSGGGPLPGWYQIASAIGMLASIGFTGLFTAGIVNRSSSLRLSGIIGSRVPRTRSHVVVIGVGQIGLRLCLALQTRGVAVVAVERNADAPSLRLARAAHVPILVAHAEDRHVLRRLRVDRAIAVAAMGADELENVEVALAALAEAPGARVVIRSGENAVIAETRSLFSIGAVCDVPGITAEAVTQQLRDALGMSAQTNCGSTLEDKLRCLCDSTYRTDAS
jgi:hypothetical protein